MQVVFRNQRLLPLLIFQSQFVFEIIHLFSLFLYFSLCGVYLLFGGFFLGISFFLSFRNVGIGGASLIIQLDYLLVL